MARAILLAAAVVWTVAAIATVGVAIVGIDRLLAILPPLAIDADALRGAIVALAVGTAIGAGTHAVLVVLLGADGGRRRLASTVALLMSGLLTAAFLGLAAAAAASAVAQPGLGIGLWVGAAAGVLAAAAYVLVAFALVVERRSVRPGRPA